MVRTLICFIMVLSITIVYCSESNEIGELETSPSNMGEDCLSMDMMAEWHQFSRRLLINYKLHIIACFVNINILFN